MACYQQLKVDKERHDDEIEEYFERDFDYTAVDNDPCDLSMEDVIFVRYFAYVHRVQIVVHMLFSNNHDDKCDATIGKRRWQTKLYYQDGSATVIHKGFSSFTILDWHKFPHQIILYQVEDKDAIIDKSIVRA